MTINRPIDLKLMADASHSGGNKFKGAAYTGSAVWQWDYDLGYYQAVIDVSSIKAGSKIPVLHDHNDYNRLGVIDNIDMSNGQVDVSGYFLSGDQSNRIASELAEGFPWQLSVYTMSTSTEKMTGDFEANGRTYPASESNPVYLMRDSTLKEVSFVTFGADDQTHASKLRELNQQEATQVPKPTEGSEPAAKKTEVSAPTSVATPADSTDKDAKIAALEMRLSQMEEDARLTKVQSLVSKLGLTEQEQIAEVAKLDSDALDVVSKLASSIKPAAATKAALLTNLPEGDIDGNITAFNPLMAYRKGGAK